MDLQESWRKNWRRNILWRLEKPDWMTTYVRFGVISLFDIKRIYDYSLILWWLHCTKGCSVLSGINGQKIPNRGAELNWNLQYNKKGSQNGCLSVGPAGLELATSWLWVSFFRYVICFEEVGFFELLNIRTSNHLYAFINRKQGWFSPRGDSGRKAILVFFKG